MLEVLILLISLSLQLAAAYMALRLIRITGWRIPWVLVSAAVFLMATRRGITLTYYVMGGLTNPPHLMPELTALAISVLMVAGFYWIGPEFIAFKRATAALGEAEALTENIIQTANVIFVGLDTNGCVTRLNQMGERITGYSQAELIGQNWFETLVPKERYPFVWEEFNRLIAGGIPRTFENPIVTKSGEERHVIWQNNAVRRGEEIAGMISFGNDITDRKRAEEALQKEEKRLHTVVNQAPIVVWSTDSELRFTLSVGAGLAGLGLHPNQVIGYSLFEYFQTDDPELDSIQAHYRALKGESVSYETSWQDRTFDTHVEPMRDSEGRIIGVIGVAVDITERTRAEESLREREARLRAIIDNEPDCVKLVGRDGNLLEMNPAGLRLIQAQSLAEVKGHCIFLLVVEEHREAYRRLHEQIFEGRAASLEFDILGLRGTRLTLETQEAPLRAPSGEIIAALGITRDITERKRADASLRLALAEVERLKNQIEAEKTYLQEEIRTEHNFEEIIGRSPGFTKILHEVEQVASTGSTVLILGETGTGKELIARAVHNISPRHNRALVKVNCASLPGPLIESELFGHEKGAFTGAFSRRLGRFEQADSGTIFLDEIGDLPPDLQMKLLRILQEGEFERLGGTKTIKVDVRVIAATNRDLAAAIRAGSFRSDLYFRLNVFPILIPPLRERPEDIPLLVKHFIDKYAGRIGKKIDNISRGSLELLKAYPWPGNIRELENIIERAVILCAGPTLEIGERFNLRPADAAPPGPDGTLEALKQNEQRVIREALEETRWVIEGPNGAAARLGIAPSTLRDRIKKFDINKI